MSGLMGILPSAPPAVAKKEVKKRRGSKKPNFYKILEQSLQEDSGSQTKITQEKDKIVIKNTKQTNYPTAAVAKQIPKTAQNFQSTPATPAKFFIDDPADPHTGVIVSQESGHQEVCVVNLREADWWTVVGDSKSGRKHRDPEYERCELDNDCDGYVVVKEDDVTQAIAEFIALTLMSYPKAKGLSENELKSMIDTTFSSLNERSQLMQMYDWAQFVYTTYGWGSCAIQLYQEPSMVKFVASSTYTMARWALVFLI